MVAIANERRRKTDALAMALVTRFARAVTVNQVLPSVSLRNAKAMYQNAWGKASPSGRLPEDVLKMIGNAKIKPHIDVFMDILDRAFGGKDTASDTFIHAYAMYYDRFAAFNPSTTLSAESAYLLTKHYYYLLEYGRSRALIEFKKCKTCGVRTVSNVSEMSAFCQVHDVSKGGV
jgi:hypothetical protein